MKPRHFLGTARGCLPTIFGLFLICKFATLAAVTPQVLNFEDLHQPGSFAIPNGYGGLQWSNFWHADMQFSGESGMLNGAVTQRRLAYNAYGDPAAIWASTPFNVGSAYLTGVWNDGLNVQIRGYNGTTLLHNNVFTIDSITPSLINLNYYGITRLDFVAFGGVSHGWRGFGGGGDGPVFCMDNLALVPIPEPSHIAIAGIGLLCLLVTRKRRVCFGYSGHNKQLTANRLSIFQAIKSVFGRLLPRRIDS